MTQAFHGLRVIDATHVLAGPFASYQMAVLGAEVIKVESPHSPDQARMQGPDRALNDIGMGTAFMAQASNKNLITHLAQPPWIRYNPRTNKGFGRRDADGSQCGAVPERA